MLKYMFIALLIFTVSACSNSGGPTLDDTPPSIPEDLDSVDIDDHSISINFSASSDDDVARYNIYRKTGSADYELIDFVLASATAHTDSGLEPLTTYSYVVTSVDNTGNESAMSLAVEFTTMADVTSPPVPVISTTAEITLTTILLTWDTSDDQDVITYKVYRDGESMAIFEGTETQYRDEGLTQGVGYRYRVTATDPSGNSSGLSAEQSFTTPVEPDILPPSTPIMEPTAVTTHESIVITWGTSTDNVAVQSYNVYRDNTLTTTLGAATNSYTDTGLEQAETHSYTVSAVDTTGNESSQSTSYSFTTQDIDSPTVPSNFILDSVTANAAMMSWDFSTDNSSVVGYRVYRDGSELAEVTHVGQARHEYFDQTLLANSSYSYEVTAYDASSNESIRSTALLVDTPDSNVTTKVFPSQINLNWDDASNSDGSVTYNIYRDNIQIASTQQLSYQDNLLSPETTYQYKIKIDMGAADTLLSGGEAVVQTTARRHTIQVYETAGNDITDQLVSTFIPLPYGVYDQTETALRDTFVVKNGTGSIIPAQFWVRSRWHARDNSIKELVAVFKVSVSANGISTYTFEDGVSGTPSTPVTAVETVDSIVISNENVSFTINKTAYNFLDSVSYKGAPVIDNNPDDGPYIINRFGEKYRDSDDCTTASGSSPSLTPLVFEVEEAGPIRVRVRVERPAYIVQDDTDSCFSLFSESKDPVPGFVVWFDLAYDSDEISVNYNTLNNAITPFRDGKQGDGLVGWPLFFEESGIIFTSALNSPTAQITADGSILNYSAPVVQDGESTLLMGGGTVGQQGGAIAISDGTGLGFSIIDPFFHKTYPAGWDFNSSTNKLNYQLSPNDCTTCEGFSSGFANSNSGVYALNDLSIKEKRFVIKLFDSGADIMADALAQHREPAVATLSVSDFSALGTSTDMFGMVQPFVESSQTLDSDFSGSQYRTHQQVFGINFSRYRSCATGDVPYTAMDTMMVRPPRINQLVVDIYDDIKRPQVVPALWGGTTQSTSYQAMLPSLDISSVDQVTEGHHAAEFSTSGYCKNLPMRAFFGNSVNTYVSGKAFPAGYSGSMSAYPRDNAHLWMQQLSDAPVDNPMLGYFKRGYEQYLQAFAMQLQSKFINGEDIYESVGDAWPDPSVRGAGNSLISMVDYYLESGDSATLSSIEVMMDVILVKQQAHGGLNENISFQDGYMMTGVLNAMSLVPRSHTLYKKGWSYLYGGGDRAQLPGIIDAIMTVEFGYYDTIGCIENGNCKASDGTGASLVDPIAIAAYILATQPNPYTGATETARPNALISHVVNYLDGNYGRGPYFISAEWRVELWKGALIGRMVNLIGYYATTPTHQWVNSIQHKEGMPIN